MTSAFVLTLVTTLITRLIDLGMTVTDFHTSIIGLCIRCNMLHTVWEELIMREYKDTWIFEYWWRQLICIFSKTDVSVYIWIFEYWWRQCLNIWILMTSDWRRDVTPTNFSSSSSYHIFTCFSVNDPIEITWGISIYPPFLLPYPQKLLISAHFALFWG